MGSGKKRKKYNAIQVLEDRWRWTFRKSTGGFRHVTEKEVLKALKKYAQLIRS